MNVIRKSAPSRAAPGESIPSHERVYQSLRDQILFGEMAPGQPVTIQGLAERLDAGMTPVRETIRRLISEGALSFLGNRRVIVPTLDADALEQLVFLRKTMECELAVRALPHIDGARLTLLSKLDARLDAAISSGDIQGYLVHNYRFHQAVYANAQAPVLAETAERLWLRFGPSLRVVCGRFGTENLPDRHKDLLVAFRTRSADAAREAIAQDITEGMAQIAAMLDQED